MRKEVIEKLGLIETGKTIGDSFSYGVMIYLFKDGIYCTDGDVNGFPGETGRITFLKGGNFIVMTEEFVLDIPLYRIRKILF